MTQMPDRDVDLGVEGITGSYTKFMSLLGRAIADAIIIAAVWRLLPTLPANVDYHLTPTIGAFMLIRVALALWALFIAWLVVRMLLHAARWLRLERQGMQWVEQDGELRRVTFYRASDGILRTEEMNAAQRQAEDQSGRRYRLQGGLRDAVVLTLLVAAYEYLPQGFAWAHPYLSANWQYRFSRFDIPDIAGWALLLFGIVPLAVGLLMIVLESLIHAAGAQFIPGAKTSGAGAA